MTTLRRPTLLRLGGRRLAAAAAVVGAAAVLIHRIALWTGGGASGSVHFRTDTHADGLLIGCAIALVVSIVGLRRLPGAVADATCVAGLGVVALCSLGLGRGVSWGAMCIAAGAILVGALRRPDSFVARALSLRPVVAVGRRSYGIYMWHYPIGFLIIWPHLSEGPQSFAVTLAVTLPIAWLSHRWVESPFLRRKELVGTDRRPQDVPAVVAA